VAIYGYLARASESLILLGQSQKLVAAAPESRQFGQSSAFFRSPLKVFSRGRVQLLLHCLHDNAPLTLTFSSRVYERTVHALDRVAFWPRGFPNSSFRTLTLFDICIRRGRRRVYAPTARKSLLADRHW
jgi:hypothetical protein